MSKKAWIGIICAVVVALTGGTVAFAVTHQKKADTTPKQTAAKSRWTGKKLSDWRMGRSGNRKKSCCCSDDREHEGSIATVWNQFSWRAI